MTLAAQMTRIPRPFDPERGAAAAALLPGQPTELADLIAGAAGTAPYLHDLLAKENVWLAEALQDPDAASDAELAALPIAALRDVPAILRRAKRRLALLVALMDLGGIWELEKVTGTLTRLADVACDVALKAALAPLIARGKLPGVTEEALAHGAGMVVLAMGKMGAGELNYSSDIDLICLFDQDRFDPADFHDARAAFIKATRAMAKTLSDVSAGGYVFRTDLRLRPDPAVTPVCLSMEAAERYYESLGRTWERAAYIKARPAAGDIAAGERFLQTLTPFVWRKHLDFAAIEDAHNMRLAIRAHKGLGGPITLPGHNMKLGRGGIREIEFFTQTRQLIAGGRDPSLRARGTVPALRALSAAGWVPEDTSETLADHYRFHRTVEHRIQMMRDAQTHNLPGNDEDFARLACLMGQDLPALEAELKERLSAVHADTEGFFAPSATPEPPREEGHLTAEVMTRWLAFPALRTERARASLDRLRPLFETRLAAANNPDAARLALDGFLAGLPAGVQVLALFEANPSLIDLVLDVAGTSSTLADYLSKNAQVLDAVIGGAFFADWTGQLALEDDLRGALKRLQEPDYETTLDAARRWTKEWHFRIGVHLLRGLTKASEAGAQYADLARAVLAVLWPVVQANFARRHGPAPGRGAALLGMGALGAGQMNARSDLDLIVIYDAGGDELSDGPRPLAVRPYFARLTQALITAMSAPMAEGRLYEVDMRLRPSGNQGPVATSWASFAAYQQGEAWTWEHLALTRAAVIAGPQDLTADIETFRCDLLGAPRDAAKIAHDVAGMRARLAGAKPPQGWLDVKAGPGALQDVELLAQTGALLSGDRARSVSAGLEGLVQMGVLDADAAAQLEAAHRLHWQVQLGGRLLAPSLVDETGLGPRGTDLLLNLTDHWSLSDLQTALSVAQAQARAIISATLTALQETDR